MNLPKVSKIHIKIHCLKMQRTNFYSRNSLQILFTSKILGSFSHPKS